MRAPSLANALPPSQVQDPAKSVCRRCPKVDECAAHAVEAQEFGMWGGLSARERRQMRTARRAA